MPPSLFIFPIPNPICSCGLFSLQKLKVIMNVHSLRDRPPPDSARRMQQQRNNPQGEEEAGLPWDSFSPIVTEEQIRYAEQKRVLLVSGGRRVKNPRDENYWDMLVNTFCPTFACLSITIFVILADFALFVTEVSLGLNKQGSFLEVEVDTLKRLGGNYGPGVASGEVYRLVSAIFLHVNFIHVIGNMFSTFILLTRVEHTFGPLRTLIIYLLCGIGGNIFSLAISSQNEYYQRVRAGASTSLYGLIGLLIGYLVLNWRGLDQVGQQMKCNMVCTVVFMFIFVLIFTPYATSIDYFGHLGGFLTGLWTPAFLEPLYYGQREKVIRVVYIALLIIQFAATFVGFYFGHPK